MKKICILILALLVLCGCGAGDTVPAATPTPTAEATPTPAPTPVPILEPLEFGLPLELTDRDRETWVGGTLIFRNEQEKIGSLYIEWGYIPGQWTLTADGETITAGQGEYLHEYITFDPPVSQVQLDAPAPVCEAYAFSSDGAVPDWVQVWQPPVEQADLLLMPTHADDEHVFFGGMMPYYAGEKGYKTQVVYLTNHWGQSVRPHELLDGLWTAGITNYPVISNFPDYYAEDLDEALELYDDVAVQAWQVEMIRRFKPGVIIGHDLKGEYGHGVHILNAVCLTQTVAWAADETVFEGSAHYGAWDTPKLYLHLYPKNEIIMNWDEPLEAFGGKTAFQVAQEGFACHVTQQGAFHVYGDGEDYDSRRFGLYRSLVGPDVVGGDVFENLSPAG